MMTPARASFRLLRNRQVHVPGSGCSPLASRSPKSRYHALPSLRGTRRRGLRKSGSRLAARELGTTETPPQPKISFDQVRRAGHDSAEHAGDSAGQLFNRLFERHTVYDRYITSPRQVRDRLNQIQSLRGDTGKPLCMAPPLAQRPDPRAASLATAPCHSSTRRRRRALGHRLRGSFDGRARADAEACPGRGYEQSQPAARREQDGEELAGRRCTAYTSQASSPGPGERDKTGANRQSKRFHGPLLRPGRCPLYVRNDCYAMTYSGTR